jgi:hypothetical protein
MASSDISVLEASTAGSDSGTTALVVAGTFAEHRIKVANGDCIWIAKQKDQLGGTFYAINGGHGYVQYSAFLTVRCIFNHTEVADIGWTTSRVGPDHLHWLKQPATHLLSGKHMRTLLDLYPADVTSNSIRKCWVDSDGEHHDSGCNASTHKAVHAADLTKVGLEPQSQSGHYQYEQPNAGVPLGSRDGGSERVSYFGVNGEVQDGTYTAGRDPSDTPGYCWTACFDAKLQQALATRYGAWLSGREVHSLMVRNPLEDHNERWTLSEIATDAGTRLHVSRGAVPGLPSYNWAQLAMRLYLCTDAVGGLPKHERNGVEASLAPQMMDVPGYCYLALVGSSHQQTIGGALLRYPKATDVASQLAGNAAVNRSWLYNLTCGANFNGLPMLHIERATHADSFPMSADAVLAALSGLEAYVGAPAFVDGSRFCEALTAASKAEPYEYRSLGRVLVGGGSVGAWRPDWYGGNVIGGKDRRWQAAALFSASDDGIYTIEEAYYYVSGFVESALTACMGAFVTECGKRGLLPDPTAVQHARDAQMVALTNRVEKVEHEVFGQGLSGVGCLGYVLAEAGIATSSKVRRLDELSELHLAQFKMAIAARGGIYVRYKGQEDSYSNHLTWTNQVTSETLGLVKVDCPYFEDKMHVSWYATTVFNPRAHTGLADKVMHIENYLLSCADDMPNLQTVPEVASLVDSVVERVGELEKTMGTDAGYKWQPNQLTALWRGMAVISGRSGSKTWVSRDIKWPRCASNKNVACTAVEALQCDDASLREQRDVDTVSHPLPTGTQTMESGQIALRSQLTLRGLSERTKALHEGLVCHPDGEYALKIASGHVTAVRLSPCSDGTVDTEPSYCRAQLQKVDAKLDPFSVQNMTPDHINVNWSSVDADGLCTPGAQLMLGLEDIDRASNIGVEAAAATAPAGDNAGNGEGAHAGVEDEGVGDVEGEDGNDQAAQPPTPPRITSNLQLTNRIKTLMAAALMMAYANGDMNDNYGVKRMIASALVGAVAMTEDVKEVLSHGQRDRGWIADYDNLGSADERLDMVMHRMEEIMGGTEYHHRELVCTRLMGVSSAVFNYWDKFPAVHS